MSSQKQGEFVEEYNRLAKSVGLTYLLWFVLKLQYGLHQKMGTSDFILADQWRLFNTGLIDIFRIPV